MLTGFVKRYTTMKAVSLTDEVSYEDNVIMFKADGLIDGTQLLSNTYLVLTHEDYDDKLLQVYDMNIVDEIQVTHIPYDFAMLIEEEGYSLTRLQYVRIDLETYKTIASYVELL